MLNDGCRVRPHIHAGATVRGVQSQAHLPPPYNPMAPKQGNPSSAACNLQVANMQRRAALRLTHR